jgi:hypothetical protein
MYRKNPQIYRISPRTRVEMLLGAAAVGRG